MYPTSSPRLRLSKILYGAQLFLGATVALGQGMGIGTGGGGGGEDRAPGQRQSGPAFGELMESVGRSMTEGLRDLCGLSDEGGTEWNGNSSPKATVFTFVEGMDALQRLGSRDTARVAQTLPEGFAPQDDAVVALKAVFDRLGDLRPIDFPGEVALEDLPITTFEVFPYAVDHEWVWQVLNEPPSGKIEVIARPGSAEWTFSRETLEGAESLLEELRPIAPSYGTSNRDNLVGSVFIPLVRDTPWWAWVILVVATVAALFAGRWIKRVFYRWAGVLDDKVRPVVGSMVRSLGLAVAILVAVTIFIVGGASVEFPPLLAELHWAFIKLVLVVAAVWLILGLTDIVAILVRKHALPESNEYGEMAVTIIQRVVRSFFFVILLAFVLENVLGVNIGALIAGFGILGLALSLAGKEVAQNLFGAVSVFINRPFVVGDWIEFKGALGEVTDVRMQATYIRILDGEMLIVPNMQFVSNAVENLSMRKFLRREMNIALPYNTEPDKVGEAIELIEKILRSDDIVKEGRCDLEEKAPLVSFDAFGEYHLNLKVYYWYFIGSDGQQIQRNHERGWFSYLEHCTMVNRAILEGFAERGLEFAFPTQTLEIESIRPLATGAASSRGDGGS